MVRLPSRVYTWRVNYWAESPRPVSSLHGNLSGAVLLHWDWFISSTCCLVFFCLEKFYTQNPLSQDSFKVSFMCFWLLFIILIVRLFFMLLFHFSHFSVSSQILVRNWKMLNLELLSRGHLKLKYTPPNPSPYWISSLLILKLWLF